MGDLVYLKGIATPGHLQEKWRGQFKVILTTPTATKLAGFPSWVHVQNLKSAAPQKTYQSLLMGPTKIKISCSPRSQKTETHPQRLLGHRQEPYAWGPGISPTHSLYSPPFFPVSSCPRFYSFLYTHYSEVLDFPPPSIISLPPFSYFCFPYFIDWIAYLHLQGTLSDFTPEEIYSFSNILLTFL
jgi:hypothetical protein